MPELPDLTVYIEALGARVGGHRLERVRLLSPFVYSDEILHAARLSPLKLSRSLTDLEFLRLYEAMRGTLTAWIERLRKAAHGGFPEKVTAFHDAMAVHGRFKQPCPVCGSPVQRIVYAENECNKRNLLADLSSTDVDLSICVRRRRCTGCSATRRGSGCCGSSRANGSTSRS